VGLDPERFRKWSHVAVIGPVLAIAIFGGYFLGHWADGKLGTGPWCMIAGILLGTLGGFLEMLRQIREASDDEPRGGSDKGPGKT
jgi:F0F1-type ATP synthase assembly protein I